MIVHPHLGHLQPIPIKKPRSSFQADPDCMRIIFITFFSFNKDHEDPLLCIVFLLLSSGCLQSGSIKETPITSIPTTQQNSRFHLCHMDAKICPDGSIVGRVGPNCEFSLCPAPIICSSFSSDNCPSPCAGCGDSCINPRFDENNCGECGNVCLIPPNSNPICLYESCSYCHLGSCAFECMMNYEDCDDNLVNGCETKLDTNDHCGECKNSCASGTNCVNYQCIWLKNSIISCHWWSTHIYHISTPLAQSHEDHGHRILPFSDLYIPAWGMMGQIASFP